MGKSRMRLGWFNAWIGFIWIFLLIHSFKFFFAYESFLKRSFNPISVSLINVEINSDSSEMKLLTNKGNFYTYNKNNFQIIKKLFDEHKITELWYDKENRNIADLKVDGKFLIKRTELEIALYAFGLIVSGSMLLLSILLVVKTKGWGTYELMEKHKKV